MAATMTTDRIEALLQDSRVIWTEDVLRFRDTDLLGHVNNSIFAVFAESGRVRLFRSKLDPTLDQGTFFVIARLCIDFRAELHYPGRVRTGSWLTRLGRSSIGIGQVMLGDGGLAGEAEAVCVLMDGETRRARPFNEATRQAVESLLRP